MFGGSSKTSKCKTQLRMVVSRIKILRSKREVQVKHLRRDVAQLLSKKQDANARTRAEHAIREQNMVDAYNLIEGYCSFLESRVQSMSGQKECPPDLKESVASLIYAGPRCAELPELLEIRSIFSSKFGKQFIATIVQLRVGCGVSRMIIEKLSTQPIPTETKLKLMHEVAREHGIRWEPEDLAAGEMKAGEKKPSVVQLPTAITRDQTSSPNSPLSASVRSSPTGHEANSEADSEEETDLPHPPAPAPAPAPQQASDHRQQFIPFIPASQNPDPYSQYTKGIVNPYLTQDQSSPVAGALGSDFYPKKNQSPRGGAGSDPYAEFQRKFMSRGSSNVSSSPFLDVASAAEAAAESADQAAAAARAAATLAHRHLSRESSMIDDAAIPVARPVSRKAIPVNLEDRVASYLRERANETDSSEWDSPLPREESQMLNPGKDLFEEQMKFDEPAPSRRQAHHPARPEVEPGLFRAEGSREEVSGVVFGKPVFDDGEGLKPGGAPRFDEAFRVESFAVHLESMNENLVARTEKLFEKEDSVGSEAWKPTRRHTYAGGFESSGSGKPRQELELDDDELVARFTQLKAKKQGEGFIPEEMEARVTSVFKSSNASEEERRSWRFSEPPSRSPPRVELDLDAKEKEKHRPDLERRFQGAGVDYSEQSSLAPKKANRFGMSVRTKRT